MKKYFLLAAFSMMLSFSASAQFNFGAGAQLIFDGSVFGVQGKAMYELTDAVRLSGSFTLHLEDFFDWSIDLDAHYKLITINEDIDFYPLAGINFFRVSVLGVSATNTGLNIGAGAFIPVGESLNIYVEPKFIIDNGSAFAVSAGILF